MERRGDLHITALWSGTSGGGGNFFFKEQKIESSWNVILKERCDTAV